MTNVHRAERVGAWVTEEPSTYQCGDSVLMNQQRTGGLPVTRWDPCWDMSDEYPPGERIKAQRVRRVVAETPAVAEVDVGAACNDINARERTHSAFSHKKSIERVIPHRVAGELAGVRIVFKPVPALTKTWLEDDIKCQHARWVALGKPATDDPTLVENASVEVIDRGSHLEVLVEADTVEDAQVSFERAKGSLTPEAGSQRATR